jgi:predicted membrane protein
MNRQKRREERRNRKGHSRISTGLILVLIGALLIIQRMGTVFPTWFFTWQVLLIGLGIFFGLSKNFRGNTWFVLILIGGIFLAADLYPEWNLHHYTGPIILIIIGLTFVLRPRHHRFLEWPGAAALKEKWDEKKNPYEHDHYSDEDYLDVTNVLGGTKKNITSKNFRGGEITSFLGGSEINLSQADINGSVVLELTQVMGGTKLIVPAHWDIKSELVTVFGSIEDKRQLSTTIDPTKILVLKGTTVFGGIDIRSY